MKSASERHAMGEPVPGRLFRHRFLVLLASLLLMLLVLPFLRSHEARISAQFSAVIVSGLFSAILLAAVYAVRRSRAVLRIALALVLPAILLQGINIGVGSPILGATAQLLGVLFLALIYGILVRFLFSSQRVTLDMIAASLCGYLILGVLWSILYSLLELLQPGSFALGGSDRAAASMHFGAHDTVVSLYYSLVTLTTLGYGDIAPISGASRMLAAVEAVVGQFYVTVLVARLVGLHISHVAADSGKEASAT